MPKYNCVGCGMIHSDSDYSKEDGDILVTKEQEEMIKLIDDGFKEIGWLDEKHKGILNFKAFSNGAWTDVQKIRELYERLLEKINQKFVICTNSAQEDKS